MSLSTVAHETFVIERIYDVPVAQTSGHGRIPAQGPLVCRSAEVLGAATNSTFGSGAVRPIAVDSGRARLHVRVGVPRHHPRAADRLHVRNVCRRVLNLGVVATVLFSGHDATSQLVLTEQGVFLDGHDTVAQREAGTRSLLDSLAASLKSGGS